MDNIYKTWTLGGFSCRAQVKIVRVIPKKNNAMENQAAEQAKRKLETEATDANDTPTKKARVEVLSVNFTVN